MFSEVKGQEATKVEGVTAELSTETSYGDYELDLDGLPEEITSDNVNAVVVKTTDGTAYGMRHLENIWRGNETRMEYRIYKSSTWLPDSI